MEKEKESYIIPPSHFEEVMRAISKDESPLWNNCRSGCMWMCLTLKTLGYKKGVDIFHGIEKVCDKE